MTTAKTAIFLIAFAFSFGGAQAAELPALASGTLSGKVTSAQFRAGATADDSSSFADQFNPNTPISVVAEIQTEAAHVGTSGNLYTVALVGSQAFMQDATGTFNSWDLNPATLVAREENRILAEVEQLAPISNLALGPLGLAGASLSFYFAYGSASAPGELFYNSTALALILEDYSPLSLTYATEQIIDTTILDTGRNREIPVLIYLSSEPGPSPTLLFSHGLGGDRFAVGYLAEQWSQRGFNVINLQHPGSDSSIVEGIAASEILAAFESAASLENSIARIEDVSAVLDQLELWNAEIGNQFYQRIDFNRIGMSGHSFGARTTQSVSGQAGGAIPGSTRDPRIKAAVIFSPSPPGLGDANAAFAQVDIPWMLMTGTLDDSGITDVTPEQRTEVYPALPPGGKYELVLFEGEHHAFTDRDLSPSQAARNPAHHPQIQALTTAFWEAWLRDDISARDWLDGTGAESVLQPGDSWQFK